MSQKDRDLTPVLPKKLRPFFNHNLLNYFIIGLFFFTLLILETAADNVHAPFVLIVWGLLFVISISIILLCITFALFKDKTQKVYSIVGNILILLFCVTNGLSIIHLDLVPFLDYNNKIVIGIGTACAGGGLWGAILLFLSSRRTIIAMGPRRHAAKRLNLAEISIFFGALIPLSLVGLTAFIGASPYPLLAAYALIVLLCIINILRAVKLPKMDFAAWDDEASPAPKQSFFLPLLLLTLGAFVMGYSFSFASYGQIFTLCLCLIPSCLVGKIIASIGLNKNKLGFLPIMGAVAFLACILLGLSSKFFASQGALALQCIIYVCIGAIDSTTIAQLSQNIKRNHLLFSSLGLFFLFLLSSATGYVLATVLQG